VPSLAKLFYWLAAEALADAHGTLGFRGIPVENHCPNHNPNTFSNPNPNPRKLLQ